MSCSANVLTAVVASSSFIREGLTSYLNGTHFQVVTMDTAPSEMSEPSSGQSLPSLILAAPDDAHSVETTRALHAACPEAKLVIFGRADAPETLPKDLCFVAQAVLDRDIDREILIKALNGVMSGVTVQSSGLFSWLLERPKASFGVLTDQQPIVIGQRATDMLPVAGAPPIHLLSSHELKVLQCIAGGASNKVIALKFALTEGTVKIHVKNILRKLKAQNRTQAAIWAREQGINPT